MTSTHPPGVEALEDRLTPSATQYINALYVNFLNRSPFQAELQFYLNELSAGQTAGQVAAQFANSDEFRLTQIRVDYATFLARTATDAELNFWLNRQRNGLTDRQVQVSFLTSDEFFARQNRDSIGWITSTYQLELGRSPDAQALALYSTSAIQTAIGRANAAAQILFSAEATARAVDSGFARFLGRNVDATSVGFFIQQMNATQSVAALYATLASSTEYIRNQAAGSIAVTTTTATTTGATSPFGSPTGAIAPLNFGSTFPGF